MKFDLSINLAKFYALLSIPVAEGNYLTSTDEGRKFLVEFAKDLYYPIENENYQRIPDDEQISMDYSVDIAKYIRDNQNTLFNTYIKSLEEKFNLLPDQIASNLPEVSLKNLENLVLYLDEIIIETYERNFGKDALDTDYFKNKYYQKGFSSIKNAIQYVNEGDLEYNNEQNKISDIIEIFKEEIEDTLNNLGNLLYLNAAIKEMPFEKYKKERYAEARIHFDINNFLINFKAMIDKASNSDNSEDYQPLIGAIDTIVQMVHHGGSLLQYAVNFNGPKLGELYEVIHSKSSPYFTEWVKKQGLLPEDAEKYLENSQLLNRAIDEYDYSDQYYKTDKFKNPEQWEETNIPEYQRLSQGQSSSNIGYMNAAEIWDMSQKLMQQRQKLENYYKAQGLPIPDFVYQDYDLKRLRDMENWSKNYLGTNLPQFKFSSKLLKIAQKIDSIAPDLSDYIDRMVKNYVV